MIVSTRNRTIMFLFILVSLILCSFIWVESNKKKNIRFINILANKKMNIKDIDAITSVNGELLFWNFNDTRFIDNASVRDFRTINSVIVFLHYVDGGIERVQLYYCKINLVIALKMIDDEFYSNTIVGFRVTEVEMQYFLETLAKS